MAIYPVFGEVVRSSKIQHTAGYSWILSWIQLDVYGYSWIQWRDTAGYSVMEDLRSAAKWLDIDID